jgi:Ca2+/Na+ antiporter
MYFLFNLIIILFIIFLVLQFIIIKHYKYKLFFLICIVLLFIYFIYKKNIYFEGWENQTNYVNVVNRYPNLVRITFSEIPPTNTTRVTYRNVNTNQLTTYNKITKTSSGPLSIDYNALQERIIVMKNANDSSDQIEQSYTRTARIFLMQNQPTTDIPNNIVIIPQATTAKPITTAIG